MNTSQSIITIYKLINAMLGPIEAKKAVSDALFNIISEIHEEGLDVTEDLITEKLSKYAEDYIHASKKDVA
ncbi:MAG TPA: hypothetical protein VNJ08_03600 [Bacteriovoracaceae bacterium]|nr:hypothetical protein [Bacteriovoracaceae bacterium]